MRLSSGNFLTALRSVFMIIRLTANSWAIRVLLLTLALSPTFGVVHRVVGQTTDAFGDSGADPVKLFEQGQNAHARAESAKAPEEKLANFQKALEFYDEALKVKPEFPEAEFQRANALISL